MEKTTHKYHYFDLRPEPKGSESGTQLRDNSGNYIYDRNPDQKAPRSCFFELNLYRQKIPEGYTDYLEDVFYGRIDAGCSAHWPATFQPDGDWKQTLYALEFMAAMSVRTPKGLDYLTSFVLRLRPDMPPDARAIALDGVKPNTRMLISNWCDAHWEIVSAQQSSQKFLLSDDPVTYFNPAFDPLSWVCQYPEDPSPWLIGTRTLFPLSQEQCLIITNKEAFLTPTKATAYKAHVRLPEERGFLNLSSIAFDRKLSDAEVSTINYIVKRRARRYLAAADPNWFFPENMMKTRVWKSCLNALLPQMDERFVEKVEGYKEELNSMPVKRWKSIPARISKRRGRPNKRRGLPP